jgi:uncharacterized protein
LGNLAGLSGRRQVRPLFRVDIFPPTRAAVAVPSPESRAVRLLPRDERFFELFGEIAARIVSSAELLHDLLERPAEREALARAIKDVEHEADRLTHEVIERLNRSFITPIDREDIHVLASRLDNVVDLIDGTARRAVMFHIAESRQPALELAEVLQRCAGHIRSGVASLKRVKDLQADAHQIRVLEEEGDGIYTAAVGELFRSETSAIDVMRWKEMFDTLEKAIDACQDVANVMESIAIKHS